MKYAKLADSPYRYNRAFEGYRQEWLTEHMTGVTIVLILIAIAAIAWSIYRKKHPKDKSKYDVTHAGPVREEE